MLRKKGKEHKLERNTDFKKLLKRVISVVFFVLSFFILENNYNFCLSIITQDSTTQFQDINEIEEKVFHEKYNAEPIEKRLARLEEFIFKATHQNENLDGRIKRIKNAFLSKEQIKNESLDQITIYDKSLNLLKKQDPHIQNQPSIRTYSVDSNTGFLIDELTREIVKDSYGNQIKVNLPRLPAFNPPTNQFNPYLSFPQYPNPQYPNLMQLPNYPQNQIPSIDSLLNQYGLNNEGSSDY